MALGNDAILDANELLEVVTMPPTTATLVPIGVVDVTVAPAPVTTCRGLCVSTVAAVSAPEALGVSPPIRDAWGLRAARALAMRVNSAEPSALASGVAGGGGCGA